MKTLKEYAEIVKKFYNCDVDVIVGNNLIAVPIEQHKNTIANLKDFCDFIYFLDDNDFIFNRDVEKDKLYILPLKLY